MLMKKILLQLLILTAIFLGLWFALKQIDWMKLFRVEKATKATEEKLGEIMWEIFRAADNEITYQQTLTPLDSILTKICEANHIDRSKIKLHLLEKNEVNAFALPGNHLVVYSGLVLQSENPSELAGVMAHEVAHIQLQHVMKKLVKEVGLSVLISITMGDGGGEVVRETARMLSSKAYDRNLEKEADIKAADYLINAEIHPEEFANFLYKLSEGEENTLSPLTWMSTHPESKERAQYIIEHIKNTEITTSSLLSNKSWKQLREGVGG